MRSFHPGALLDDARRVTRIESPLAARLAPPPEAAPAWTGGAEARARFLARHPGGFADPAFRLAERAPLVEARRRLLKAAPPAAAEAGAADAAAAAEAVAAARLLAPQDAAAFRRLLAGPRGRAFLAGAARFAAGAVPAGLAAMSAAAAIDRAAAWPVLTCLPFLWRPDRHMLLEPDCAALAARRLGRTAPRGVAPPPAPAAYRALQQLGAELRAAAADLAPADNIDLLGFLRAVARPT